MVVSDELKLKLKLKIKKHNKPCVAQGRGFSNTLHKQ